MAKFTRKPVEAVQFFPEQRPWPDGVVQLAADEDATYALNTFVGPYVIEPGDWVITDAEGIQRPCKPEIFAATYELLA